MEFGFNAKEEYGKIFSPPRGRRGQGLKRWDDGYFLVSVRSRMRVGEFLFSGRKRI
jgi:hypothetical protein